MRESCEQRETAVRCCAWQEPCSRAEMRNGGSQVCSIRIRIKEEEYTAVGSSRNKEQG